MAGNPSRRHRPSPKSHACPPDRKGEVSSASAGVSILADTIGVVDGRLIRIQFSPGSFRRKFTALDLDLLMAVIAVCLAPAVHPIAADIILTALAVWAMASSRR